MSETRIKRRANRAVAALSEATGGCTVLSHSPLIASNERLNSASHQVGKRIVRFSSFEALARTRRVQDPHLAARKELESIQEVPQPRDEAAALPEKAWRAVMTFAGPGSREVARLGGTCRKLRRLVLSHCRLSTVDITPGMVPLDALSKPQVLDSLAAYFEGYTRGQAVHSLALLHSGYAATLPLTATFPSLRLCHALTLAAQLPYLTSLDVRGVRWVEERPQRAQRLFLTDLYLSAPRLRTLKMGLELYNSWTPGWWKRQHDLVSVVIGSRREQPYTVMPASSLGDGEGDGPGADAVELHPDVFSMLATERSTQWCLKVWCPLSSTSARRLLMPSTPLPGLGELTVNLSGNTELTEQTEKEVVDISAEGKKQRSRRVLPNADDNELAMYPRLTAFTMANVDERPAIVTELFIKMAVIAPKMVHFNVCATARVLPPEKVKGKKRAGVAAAAARAL